MNKYIVITPEHYSGMFGLVWQVIKAIYHNPDKLYYINFYDTRYNVKQENMFDHFFYQPHIDHPPERHEIEKFVGDINTPESNFIWSMIEPNTKEEIQKRRVIFNSIINKYLKLKPNVENKINSFANDHFLNKKILGVHLRGTDHPFKQPIEVYVNEIKKLEPMYDKIFVASDEQGRVDAVINAFGDKVVQYSALRSPKPDEPYHMTHYETRWVRNPSYEFQYKIAEDVIVESYLMSKTDFLCCFSASNVNTYARALNVNLESMEL